MTTRPKASLDDLTVPKSAGPARSEQSVPDPLPAPATMAPKNYGHTLSLRLTVELYRRLRRFVARLEDEGHGRVTHQSVIETALAEYLTRQGG